MVDKKHEQHNSLFNVHAKEFIAGEKMENTDKYCSEEIIEDTKACTFYAKENDFKSHT